MVCAIVNISMYGEINERVCGVLNLLKYVSVNSGRVKFTTDTYMTLNYLIQETKDKDFKERVYQYIIVIYLVMDKKFMSNPLDTFLEEFVVPGGGAYSLLNEKIDRRVPIPKLTREDIIDITVTDNSLLRHLYIANRSAVDSIFQRS